MKLLNELLTPILALLTGIMGFLSKILVDRLKGVSQRRDVINELNDDNEALYKQLIQMRQEMLDAKTNFLDTIGDHKTYIDELEHKIENCNRRLKNSRCDKTD